MKQELQLQALRLRLRCVNHAIAELKKLERMERKHTQPTELHELDRMLQMRSAAEGKVSRRPQTDQSPPSFSTQKVLLFPDRSRVETKKGLASGSL
jgi:hypothetical protein